MRKRMVLLALVLSSSAHAQASEPRLSYRAPPECPDRAFFSERMRARLRADGARARPAELRVVVELDAGTARGSLSIRQAGEAAQRKLQAASCREVVEGLALIAALAIAEPTAAGSERSGKARGGRGVAAAAARPATAPAPQAAEPAPAAPAAVAPVTAPEPAAAPDPAARKPLSESSGATQSREPVAEEAPAVASPSDTSEPEDTSDGDDSTSPLGFRVDAALLVLQGYAPDLAPGVQLGAAGLLGAFSLHVAGRFGLPQTQHSPDGTARFALYAALLELCGSAQLGAGFTWQACGVLESGVFSAAGEDTRNARDYSRAWLALGGGTGFSFGLGGAFGLRAGAELLVPTRRDWALLADQLVHQVPAVCLRLQLGVEARAW